MNSQRRKRDKLRHTHRANTGFPQFTSLTPLGVQSLQIRAAGAFTNLNFPPQNSCSSEWIYALSHGGLITYTDCLIGTLTVPGCWIWAGEGLPSLEQHAEPTACRVKHRLWVRPRHKEGSLWTANGPTWQDLLSGHRRSLSTTGCQGKPTPSLSPEHPSGRLHRYQST